MGFWLRIESDSGEILKNKYPGRDQIGGKAILSFLTGLSLFCDLAENKYENDPLMQAVKNWYRTLEIITNNKLCTVCRPLLECIWADQGEFIEYREDEYTFYLHRNLGFHFTEVEFRQIVHDSKVSWKPIDEVLEGVQFLLNTFQNPSLITFEGNYEPEHTIPDFEALYLNLKLLVDRGNDEVRLNFY